MHSLAPRVRFAAPLIALHWVTLILIACVYALMEFRSIFPKGTPNYLLMRNWHYALGISIWLMTFARLGIRIATGRPAITPRPPTRQERAALMAEVLLYILLLSVPLLGWLMMNAGDRQPWFFGLQLPTLMQANSELRPQLKQWHIWIADVGYALIALHAAAALWHHFVQRDDTIKRMMFSRRRPSRWL